MEGILSRLPGADCHPSSFRREKGEFLAHPPGEFATIKQLLNRQGMAIHFDSDRIVVHNIMCLSRGSIVTRRIIY
jgi:hypothetical protein